MTATLAELQLPKNVTFALQKMCDDLQRAAGPNLAGILLYGGLARGRYRPEQSDANVVLLLREINGTTLAAVTPALRTAWRSIRVEPFLMTPSEVATAAQAFATKFLDIKDHHLVLVGEDPFKDLHVPLEAVRQSVYEALLNIRFRMRQRYFRAGNDPSELTLALTAFARPLALEAAALLRCAGKEFSAEDRTSAIFDATVAAFSLNPAPLFRLAELRNQDTTLPDAEALYTQVLGSVDQLLQVVEKMKNG